MGYIVGAVLVAVMAFFAGRIFSAGRGARIRDKRLQEQLAPLLEKLNSKEPVTVSEIFQPARQIEVRYFLFHLLREKGRDDLIPTNFSFKVDQAQAALAYWLMHPNEMGDPPEKIEHLQELTRDLKGEPVQFHLFRYRMPEEHWAAEDGWRLGIVGPMKSDISAYAEPIPAFSRQGDIEGQVDVEALAEAYLEKLG